GIELDGIDRLEQVRETRRQPLTQALQLFGTLGGKSGGREFKLADGTCQRIERREVTDQPLRRLFDLQTKRALRRLQGGPGLCEQGHTTPLFVPASDRSPTGDRPPSVPSWRARGATFLVSPPCGGPPIVFIPYQVASSLVAGNV